MTDNIGKIEGNEQMAHDEELDAQGLLCPEPLMLLRNRVRAMTVGQTIRILATDPSTERDFRNFCRFLGHELMCAEMTKNPFEFYIKKLK
jgi:tRNA 2-thiouridine synthesizing protein A